MLQSVVLKPERAFLNPIHLKVFKMVSVNVHTQERDLLLLFRWPIVCEIYQLFKKCVIADIINFCRKLQFSLASVLYHLFYFRFYPIFIFSVLINEMNPQTKMHI